MITNIEDYFDKGCGRCKRFATADCSTRQWLTGLIELRDLCLGAGLTETLKWAHPCYMHSGRNIAIIGALRNDFRLSFFNPSLLKDPESILEKQGPNTQHADMIRFKSNNDVRKHSRVISAYLQEAATYAQQGILPEKTTTELELPEELVDALQADSELSDAFHSLTPGRQRSYVINLTSAKKPATRITRIEKFRSRIIEGKGANER
jgi:uncharacterized protein YdeI (YjbR/CyaY-like superfamily)